MVYSYYVCSLNLSWANVCIKMNLRRTVDFSRLFAQTMAVNAEFEHFIDTILKLRYTSGMHVAMAKVLIYGVF